MEYRGREYKRMEERGKLDRERKLRKCGVGRILIEPKANSKERRS